MQFHGRITTSQRFGFFKNQMLTNQSNYFDAITKVNSQKKISNSYETPQAAGDSIEIRAALRQQNQIESNLNTASFELDLAESSLTEIKNVMDRIKENALAGASDTLGPEERISLGKELRLLGESLVALANAKSGEKHIFSGTQSNLQTISVNNDAAFNTFSYKEGQADLGIRQIEDVSMDLDLFKAYAAPSDSAKVTGSNAPATVTGTIKLVINDGNDNNIDIPEITFAGANMATVVTTINTQFNAAGGAGSIAVESPPGQLSLDTSLITGSLENQSASITIEEGSGPTALTDLGLNRGINHGESNGVLHTIAKLEAAFNSNDAEAIRDSLTDIDANIAEAIRIRAKIGAISNRISDKITRIQDQKINLTEDLSEIEDIVFAEAVSDLNIAQNALQASMQMGSIIFNQNIFQFINV